MNNVLRYRSMAWLRLVGILLLASLVSVGFFVVDALRAGNWQYNYLLWNLFLAWLPLVFAGCLMWLLERRAWLSFWPIAFSLLWLGFLPNSFYMLSDYIHLQDASQVTVLYNALMFSSFIVDGLLLGFASLLLVHRALARRFSTVTTLAQVALALLLSSYAIYLGRDLRWNTWDMLTNPGGLLVDVSDEFLHPASHPQVFLTTASFFVLMTTLYAVIWHFVALGQPTPAPKR